MEYILGYSIDSETLLGIGFTLMKLVIFLTTAVFCQVLLKRTSLVREEKRRKNFQLLWRPILTETIATIPENLPELDKIFRNEFIVEWNALYEKIGGAAHDNLIVLAQRLKINEYAMQMLISSHVKLRLTGIITLGNMQVKLAWPHLEKIAKSSDTVLSMAAYRSLVQIDTDKAIAELLPQLIKRLDWPASMVAKILKDSKNPKICELLAEASLTANSDELPNIIRYMNVLKCSNSTMIFRRILSQKIDDQIITLCLHELKDPTAIDLVYRYIDYPRWHVRVNAAHALGNIGSKEDIVHLKKLLHDRQWWVRYRAAEAIVKLPFMDAAELEKIKSELEDEKALHILEQAMAEKELT